MNGNGPDHASRRDAAPAVLRLVVQGSSVTHSPNPPKAVINGLEGLVSFGVNDIVVDPGPIRIEMSCHWRLRTYGQASFEARIEPGQLLTVYYAPPFHYLTTGSIGVTEQKAKGLGVYVAILGGLALFTLLCVLAALADKGVFS